MLDTLSHTPSQATPPDGPDPLSDKGEVEHPNSRAPAAAGSYPVAGMPGFPLGATQPGPQREGGTGGISRAVATAGGHQAAGGVVGSY